jgi:hypothetical protein
MSMSGHTRQCTPGVLTSSSINLRSRFSRDKPAVVSAAQSIKKVGNDFL